MEGTQVVRVKREVDEEEPLIKLGLAVGGGGGGGGGKRRSEFTAAQVEELEQQRLIYKYIAAGLPPPFHLVLPVWKSVAATLSNAVFYQRYPSFLRYGSVDYGSKMDPEPGRCRRTDGKKWRCSRDVFPDERYCERHRHRGRQRSRKPVESCEVTSLPSTELLKISDEELANSQKKLQSQTAKGLQRMAQSSNNGSSTSHTRCHELPENVVTVANITSTLSYRAAITTVAAAPSPTAGRMTATTSACIDDNIWINAKDYGWNYAKNIGIIRGSRNNINAGFSPKSVLQAEHMIPVTCNGLYIDNGSEELESGRCRRTDGKKWRCKKNVIPDQKYCDRHIHRGVKQMRTSGPVATASTSATAMNSTRPSQITRIAGEILNTNLTMSILARSPLMQNDEKSNSSSDSDATLTDTSLAAYEQLT
ncbi:growth-regulating factor 9 [Argentina anserina]|uniref:growth-regulating factor 9 n=1 Tax=Argentina anserina TaxID=57926 RepID=UPI0021764BF1|nr:growth-regulating factor 9 [Potentilla anserina]